MRHVGVVPGLANDCVPWSSLPSGGYSWNDTHIRAFSHTHMVGSGVTDYGVSLSVVHEWLHESYSTDYNEEATIRTLFLYYYYWELVDKRSKCAWR